MKKLTVEQAWDDFFSSKKVESLTDLAAAGWLSRKEVCKRAGVGKYSSDHMPGLESSIFRVSTPTGPRNMRFFRLKKGV